LAERLDASDRVEAWKRTQDQIREAILTRGWSDRANAFTQSFGSDELDASSLMLALVGFLPADDPRVLATINATEQRLTDDRGLVYRYRSDDSLEGEEGAFLLCTFWLAQALARAGQPARARTVFERAAAFVNDVGLLSEEVHPTSGELLGNFPQAFSNIGSSTPPGPLLRSSAARRHRLKVPPALRVRRIGVGTPRGNPRTGLTAAGGGVMFCERAAAADYTSVCDDTDAAVILVFRSPRTPEQGIERQLRPMRPKQQNRAI